MGTSYTPRIADVFIASADIKACFYQCGISPELSRWFCLPPVTREEAILLGLKTAGGKDVDSGFSSKVWPALTVLPAGFSWAFWLVSRAHLHILKLAGLSYKSIVLGAWPSRPLVEGPLELPYCDNVTCVGLDSAETEKFRDNIVTAFEDVGFEMHEISVVSNAAVTLGQEWSKRSDGFFRSRRVGDKLNLVRGSLLWIAHGAVVAGRQVEVIVGHYVACCPSCRAGLSVMRAMCSFIQNSYLQSRRAWPSVRYEAWLMARLLSLMESDLGAPWSEQVGCTDIPCRVLGYVLLPCHSLRSAR